MAYIDNKLHRGTTMDPRDYDRIGDLLMQIHTKLRKIRLKDDSIDNGMRARALHTCDQLLYIVDCLGQWDSKGML
jgi:hypothetical protein